MNSWTKQHPELPPPLNRKHRGACGTSAGAEDGVVLLCHILSRVRQKGCLMARSTGPGYTSRGSAPISAAEFSNHRQGLIQLPLKSIKAFPLITVAVGWGPYWCLLEARYKVWLLLYCYTSDPYSLHYLRACKQARNSDHRVIQSSICILDWHDESCREGFEYVLRRAVAHKNLQDAVEQSGSIKKLKWNSLEKGIIKCLTSIAVLYLF